MKITPAAIRQQSFETAFRGYEKKEVTTFLDEVSQVVEQLHQENLELKSKLQHVEGEAKRLKDVEDSLFRTLKTAEDTGASIIEEANEAADQIIAEANQTASHATAHVNQMMEEARNKAEEQAATIISAAELKAKETILALRESMQGLVRSYEGLAEQREALVKSLKRISQDTINQIELSEAHYSRLDAKAHQRAIEELSRSQAFTFANLDQLTAQIHQQAELTSAVDPADPLAEMEVIEEELEIEQHDGSPDIHSTVEESTAQIQEETGTSEAEISSNESVETPEEEAEEKPSYPIEEKSSPTAESFPKSEDKEDPKKQSGSFFDQFD